MDIVGVTASAATLIELTGAIATTITTVVTAVKTADKRLTDLSTELSQLTQYLQSVHRTLGECRAADLSLIEDELWRHSEACLAGCQSTLNELGRVVTGVKTKAQKIFKLGSLGWKSRAAIELGLRGAELECFRERIYKSNSALQTMLHTINVSLSIRNHASQNSILHELSRLKTSIDAALYASSLSTPPGKRSRSHANAARNLRDLASAAQSFHSAASSSAGTVRGDNGSIVVVRNDSVTISNEPWQTGPDTPSLQGDFPPERRERVEMYIRQGRGHHPQRDTSVGSISRPPSLRPISPVLTGSTLLVAPIEPVIEDAEDTREESFVLSDEEDHDDDEEFERAFTVALRQLALDRIKTEHYDKAIQFLREAIKRSEADANDNAEIINRLDIQLALCYILQGTWILADPLIARLGTMKCEIDVSPLFHALALGHLATYSFDSALSSCKMALRVQRRRCKLGQAVWEEYPETLGLLATIYDMMGEGIRAEVARSQLPRWYAYQHPTSEADFMKTQERFLETVLGYHVPSFLDGGCHELDDSSNRPTGDGAEDVPSPIKDGVWDAACDVTQLRTNWSRHERLEGDTLKEVAEAPFVSSGHNAWIKDDADDEFSPATPIGQSSSPLKRRMSRFFRARRQGNDAAVEQVSPVSPSTPQKSALWWRHLKLRRAKPATKQPRVRFVAADDDAQNNFKLLRMERMTTPIPEEPMSPLPSKPVMNSTEELKDCNTVYHELDNSHVEIQPGRPMDSRAFAEQALAEGRNRRKGVVNTLSPSLSPSEGMLATSFPWQPYDMDSHLRSLVRDEPDDTTQGDMEQTGAPVLKQAGAEPSTSPTTHQLPKRRGLDSIRIDTATARSLDLQAKLGNASTHDISDKLGNAIRSLAAVFCDMPTITGTYNKIVDVEAVLCKIQELQSLKDQFITLGTDSTMVMDIESAIRRLESLIKLYNRRSRGRSRATSGAGPDTNTRSVQRQERQTNKPVDQGESDSGYESMDTPGHNEPQSQPPNVNASDASDSSDIDEGVQPSPIPSSGVTRQPSFRAGDDSLGIEGLLKSPRHDQAVIGVAR